MKWFDSLVNTYEKRILFIFGLLFLCVFVSILPNFSFGQYLLGFNTMSDFYEILSSNFTEKVFAVRIIQFYLDSFFSLKHIVLFFTEIIPVRFYIIGLCCFLLLSAKKEFPFIQKIKIITLVYLISTAMMYLGSSIFVASSLQNMSVDIVVRNMNSIGILFLVISIFHISLFVLALILITYWIVQK